jgi:hypothetical protein
LKPVLDAPGLNRNLSPNLNRRCLIR